MIFVMTVEPAIHLFTVDEYERIGEGGLFAPDQRLELLAGQVIEMTPIGSRHAHAVSWLTRRLVLAVGDQAVVHAQSPLRLSDLSEPEPDLMLLDPPEDAYRSRHPRPDDVLLVIEVSDTTAGWDRRVKRPLYAAAGIVELWIVDLEARVVETATGPSANGYARVEQVLPGDRVSPVAFGDLSLSVADLLS
jgi:Uma2 family endonuclease